MKKISICLVFLTLTACKKEGAPLQSGTITYYNEVNEKIVSVIDVPSAFTPNNDGINDLFGPVLRGCLQNAFEISIFNSAHEMIFKTVDMYGTWDGTSKGIKSASGRYFYKIKAIDTTGYMYDISYGFHLVR